MNIRLDTTGQGVVLGVKVVPNSRRNALAGALGEELKVKVSQPPEGGKANAAVLQLLAEALGLPVHRLQVISGHMQAHKRVLIVGLRAAEIAQRLGQG